MSGSPGQQQQSSSTVQTGPWTAPPELYRVPHGAVLKITTAQGAHYIQVQGSSMSTLSGVPTLAGAQQMQVQQTTSPPAAPMSPMQPMQPIQPMRMGNMEMNLNPMEMRMGNMEMRMGNNPQPAPQAAPQAASQPIRRFCSQCGTPVEPSDRFCSSCGHQLQA
ncbi:MAG: zinc-ribbon domain-containing protein [Thermosynechococcaceae cyanobacterium]